MKTFKQIIAIIISPVMLPSLLIMSLFCMGRHSVFDDIIDVTHWWWLCWLFRDTLI